MYQLFRNHPKFVLAIIFANIALSALSIMLDSVVNNDGITYIAMAELFLDGDWETAKSYYSWPFYPMMIAAISKLSFLDVTLSAHLLNTLLATSMTLAFVSIVGELSNNHYRTIVIAALVILLFPSITKYRAYVIRDFGYLSFYLWSLYFIFRFCRTLEKSHLIGWLSATALSCLFRFEGIILMLVAPYFLFVFSITRTQHRKKILASLSLVILATSALVITWYLQDKYDAAVRLAQLDGQDIDNVFDLFLSNFNTQIQQETALFFGYITPLFDNIINVGYDLTRRMAGVYLVICIIAFYKGFALITPLTKRFWLVYLATNLALLIGFSIANNMTVSRYTLATSVTLLILAPFALNHWLEHLQNYKKHQRIAVYTAIILVALVSLKDLDVRTNKNHLVEAGHWLHEHLDDNTSLFSNDRIIIHYAKLGPKSNFIDRFTNIRMNEYLAANTLDNYDIIALSITHKNADELNFQNSLNKKFGSPIKIIKGNEKRSVMIFSSRPDKDNSLALHANE